MQGVDFTRRLALFKSCICVPIRIRLKNLFLILGVFRGRGLGRGAACKKPLSPRLLILDGQPDSPVRVNRA